MARPKKKRDKDVKAIKKAVKSGEIQTDPIDDYYLDPYGRPIVQMLNEAPVEVLGNRDRDLAADVLNVLGVAAREGVGLLPFAGEALDAAEVAHAAKYGTDYYGGEASPELLGGLTAAGYLVPNIIERPLRGIGRAFKRVMPKSLKSTNPPRRVSTPEAEIKAYRDDRFMGYDLTGTKSGVLDEPLVVKHGTSNPDLSPDKIKLIDPYELGRRPGSAKSKREGLDRLGGFYTAYGDEGAFMGTDRLAHQIGLEIPSGSRYVDLSDTAIHTDGMSIGDLQSFYLDGYDFIIGRNVTGRKEVIPLNEEILNSFKYNYAKGGIMKAVKKSAKSGKIRAKKRNYKKEYKKFQSSKKMKKYRAKLNKYNRKKGTYGNGDRLDASHKGRKIVKFEAQSKNRGRREKSRLRKNK